MTGFKIVNLKLLVEEIGEEETKMLLSNFSCPLNEDVEEFLRIKAIEFSKQGLAQTHLVFASYRGKLTLAGYFSLANKYITVKSNIVKGKLRQRINRFAVFDQQAKSYCLSAPLIAQLGKNFAVKPSLISGDELLELACEKISTIQLDLGGKFAYLECEDKPQLTEFYSSNGFVEYARRELEKDESGLSGDYLIQMLKYIKS